jgi:ribosomal protein S18 acetylase RimI-like enzyme
MLQRSRILTPLCLVVAVGLWGGGGDGWLIQVLLQLVFCFPVASVEGLSIGMISTNFKYRYRRATTADLPAIANLLNMAFDDCCHDKHDCKEIEHKLRQRMTEDVSSSYPHVFLVASSSSSSSSSLVNPSDGVVAFLELGTMPSPVPMEKKWNGIKIYTRPELPYVANLVVDGTCRRRKVGYTMLQLAMKIAQKWCGTFQNKGNDSNGWSPAVPFMFLSVDQDNVGALKFYENLQFEPIQLSVSEESTSTAKIYLKKNLF